jgi:hypothetical protein
MVASSERPRDSVPTQKGVSADPGGISLQPVGYLVNQTTLISNVKLQTRRSIAAH